MVLKSVGLTRIWRLPKLCRGLPVEFFPFLEAVLPRKEDLV